MPSLDFLIAAIACFLTIILIGWYGFHGSNADWIFGLLAILWSMIMMMRLMTLSSSPSKIDKKSGLAQKIIYHFHEKQYAFRQLVLKQSLGGSFVLFFVGIFIFISWQIFCASFPAQNLFFEDVQSIMDKVNIGSSMVWNNVYNWGQYFILIFTMTMMAFVLRSHGANKPATRALMIIFASYAIAGLITFLGLYQISDLAFLSYNQSISLVGNGYGQSSWFMGDQNDTQIPNLFDIVLIENGIVGLGILTFLLFVPLTTICLASHHKNTDTTILVCAIIMAIILILSAFLPFGAAVGGFMLLCSIGIFLAWGAVDVGVSPQYAPKMA